ncbi:GNAT family N-acetyltransferase [Clostridium sp. MSJ-4]|uniref:GNAT family N-acetyltransferase n=1 Tax=Clostridium simiarum TaxID=2841506 RepID=A0ABS6EYT2_9CLOT|nr:GNAT family N-acetyltransferase [Clostridium simiarum]MBU5591236.1 GNAT family N-acetyltransferase [Clostridium simiarum]
MNIEICNSEEDKHGNSKENIFLAFGDNGNYLGSAFTYPTINYHQVYETPYLIFISINIGDNMDKPLSDEVRKKLFDKVLLRAKELRRQRPDLKARIYSGFEYNKNTLDFYTKNGFKEDYSIIMEAVIPKSFEYILPEKVKVVDWKINSEQDFMKYKAMYDEIFVTPLDMEVFKEQENQKHFKNLAFLIDGDLQGGCTFFEKDGFAYVETIFVLPEKRGKGLSKIIINYMFDYFISNGLNKTKLEVWQLNKRAVELYKSFNYIEVKKNLMFPGITL